MFIMRFRIIEIMDDQRFMVLAFAAWVSNLISRPFVA